MKTSTARTIEFFRLVRLAKFARHEFVKATHCSDCLRIWNRVDMRRRRHPNVGQGMLELEPRRPTL